MLRFASHPDRSSLRSSDQGRIRTLAEAAAWSPLPFRRSPDQKKKSARARKFWVADSVSERRAWATHDGDPLWWTTEPGLAIALLRDRRRTVEARERVVLLRRALHLIDRVERLGHPLTRACLRRLLAEFPEAAGL